MKTPGTEAALLTPDARGWRVNHAGKSQSAATLTEALTRLPAKTPFNFAVPTSMALLERMTLPSVDREELLGMVQLQQEKTLPFSIEEVTNDFDVLHATETESTVAAVAVHVPSLSQLCQPLRDQKRIPQKVTIFGQHIASACPAGEMALAVWEEQEQLVVAICEGGKLGWAQTTPVTDAETFTSELPRMLLSAEMEGVSTEFNRVLLSADLPHLEPVLREVINAPLETLAPDGNLPQPATNLLPAAWTTEAHGYERTERIKQRLMMVAVVYLLLLAAGFVYLAWTKRRVQAVNAQIAQLEPHLQMIKVRKAQWEAMAPAINPDRYAVELLYQINRLRPSEEVRITTFQMGPIQFMVEGEAPNAVVASAYSEKLRNEPELSSYRIELSDKDLKLLPNEHAQFRIYGRP